MPRPEYPNELVGYTTAPENARLVTNNSPLSYLPTNLKGARSARIGSPLRVGITDPKIPTDTSKEGIDWAGIYGRYWPGVAGTNNILLSRTTPNAVYSNTLTHELGHATWMSNDIDGEVKAKWTKLHTARLATHNYATLYKGVNQQDYKGAMNDKAIPAAIRYYADDPSHSFAEMFGQYITSPTEFKNRWPAEFNYFKKYVFKGKEYGNFAHVSKE